MADNPELELDRNSFREIHKGPLANPRELWRSVGLLAGGTLLAAFAAWQLGTWWSALLPIPPAMWLGAALAGLYPAWVFGKPD